MDKYRGSYTYCLPVKNGGKMKRVGGKQNIVDCDFSKGNIFYIDSSHLLHRKNLKKDTDKIISKKKLEKVKYTKEGLFVHKYNAREAYDEDAVENDTIYFMDYNGKHVKKIFEIGYGILVGNKVHLKTYKEKVK